MNKLELRDYGMLLFHSGLYGHAFDYLAAYSAFQVYLLICILLLESDVIWSFCNSLRELKSGFCAILCSDGMVVNYSSWTLFEHEKLQVFFSYPDPWILGGNTLISLFGLWC